MSDGFCDANPEHFLLFGMTWSGNSPDLNSVQHLWARLQYEVFKQPIPYNREELIACVQEEWNSMTPEETAVLAESFGRRVEKCLHNQGCHTKYRKSQQMTIQTINRYVYK
ncbi:hypothetical protein C0J52_18022 [Blattella germanica]|nr:hypothetical protein C0J52_18022 [Blattella germanica]